MPAGGLKAKKATGPLTLPDGQKTVKGWRDQEFTMEVDESQLLKDKKA